MIRFLGRHTDAIVFNDECQHLVLHNKAQQHPTLLHLSTSNNGSLGRLRELTGIVEHQRQGTSGLLQVGVEHSHIGTLTHIKVEGEMRSDGDATLVGCLGSHLHSRHIVITLQLVATVGISQLQHFVHQRRDAVGILVYALRHLLLSGCIEFHTWCGKNLRKAIQDIQGGTNFVGYLLDEVGLHARCLLCTTTGYLQLLVSLLKLMIGLFQLIIEQERLLVAF